MTGSERTSARTGPLSIVACSSACAQCAVMWTCVCGLPLEGFPSEVYETRLRPSPPICRSRPKRRLHRRRCQRQPPAAGAAAAVGRQSAPAAPSGGAPRAGQGQGPAAGATGSAGTGRRSRRRRWRRLRDLLRALPAARHAVRPAAGGCRVLVSVAGDVRPPLLRRLHAAVRAGRGAGAAAARSYLAGPCRRRQQLFDRCRPCLLTVLSFRGQQLHRSHRAGLHPRTPLP
jgi:hypothetical protein